MSLFYKDVTTEALEAERERLDEEVRALNDSIRRINSELFRRSAEYGRLMRSAPEREDCAKDA